VLLGGGALGLAAAAVASRPVESRVGLHDLRVGRERTDWTSVVTVDWWSLGFSYVGGTSALAGYTLPDEDRRALAEATGRAIERVRTLAPADPSALARPDRLRR
jgi:hypothetical protein